MTFGEVPVNGGSVVRDRDADGRARNARPRDGLGRPLPRGVPGVPTTPEDVVLAPAEALREAERLLAAGRPFHAHEVLEGAWKACGDDARELWKGLAQLAVGITHLRRGNVTGAVRLLTRAADRLEPYAAAPPHQVAVAALTSWARALIARLADPAEVVPESELAPQLTGAVPARPAAEVPISRALVRALLAEQCPGLADREIAEPFEGFDMAVFRVGEDLAVRLPRHRGSVESMRAEIRWVGELASRWTFPTQRIVQVGRPGAGYPWDWAVTSWLPGELAADRPLAAGAAPALGRALAEIHRPAGDDAPVNSEQSIPLAEREPALRRVLPHLPAAAAGRQLAIDSAAVSALWRQATVEPGDAARVWIHADLHPYNVISLHGAFGGIIDWSDISGGDPAADLGYLYLLLPAEAVAVAFDSYGGVNPATAARARAIGLVKAATLAIADKPGVADIGWRCLTELGVIRAE